MALPMICMMSQLRSDATIAAPRKGGVRRPIGRRARRGVTLFGVVLGLMVLVFALQIILQERARAADRAQGARLAEVATVFAERWENFVHERASDPASAWAAYNTVLGVSGVAIDPIPAELNARGLAPSSWTGNSPVQVTPGLEARVYVVSLGAAPIATGMVVFTLPDDTRVLTKNSFVSALEAWRTDYGAGEDVADANQVYATVAGAALGANEVAALSYRSIRFEEEWMLREPWVGFGRNATMVGSLDMGGNAVVNAGQVAATSSQVVVSDAIQATSASIEGSVTALTLTGGDMDVVGAVEAASGAFSAALGSADISVSGMASGASAQATDLGTATGINTSFGTSGSGAGLVGTRLTIGSGGSLGALNADIQGAGNANSTQADVATVSQLTSTGALQTTGGFLLGGSGYAQGFVVNTLQTQGCTGCQ